MEVTIKVATNSNEIQEYASLALKHRLYVSGWTLSYYLKSAREKPETAKGLVLALVDDIPVGVVITKSYGTSGVFVKKAFRRHKIGTKLIKALTDSIQIKDDTDYASFQAHDKRSSNFFNKQKRIRVSDNFYGDE